MSDNIDIDISRITDEMEPYEFRINKNKDFSAYTLKTKLNELYSLIKQEDIEKCSIHYYVVSNGIEVVGRFNISYLLKNGSAGIAYHIVDEFQNRGIGQTVLRFVIGDIFKSLTLINRITIVAITERSKAIATKNGFSLKNPSTKRIFQLTREQWQELQNDMDKSGENYR